MRDDDEEFIIEPPASADDDVAGTGLEVVEEEVLVGFVLSSSKR